MYTDTFAWLGEFCRKFVVPGSSVLDVGKDKLRWNFSKHFTNCIYHTISNHDTSTFTLTSKEQYCWPLESNSYDVVICGFELEGDPFFWKTLFNISEVCRPGATICIIVSSSRENLYRFSPHVATTWKEYMNCQLVETSIHDNVNCFVFKKLKLKLSDYGK